MNLAPLLSAPMPIPPHAIAAFVSILLGAVQFAQAKGTRLHRWLGRIWVGLMGLVAASGLFIYDLRQVGPFSFIHLLSLFTLVMLVLAVRAAWNGNIPRHRRMMIQLYILALILTGAFTLMPGRIMHEVLFG